MVFIMDVNIQLSFIVHRRCADIQGETTL